MIIVCYTSRPISKDLSGVKCPPNKDYFGRSSFSWIVLGCFLNIHGVIFGWSAVHFGHQYSEFLKRKRMINQGHVQLQSTFS